MKEYELSMKILNKKYVDNLIIALARQGYAPYLSFDNDAVCFQVQEDELNEIKNRGEWIIVILTQDKAGVGKTGIMLFYGHRGLVIILKFKGKF